MFNIIPFGRDSKPAQFISDTSINLKQFDLPFDWLEISPQHLKATLDNNFKDMATSDNQASIDQFNSLIESTDNKLIFLTTISYSELQSSGLTESFNRKNIHFVILNHVESDRNVIEVEENYDHKVINQYTPDWHDLWEDIKPHVAEWHSK